MRPLLSSVPRNQCPPEEAPPVAPPDVQGPESPSAMRHLGRCSQCGALNGQSAQTCWSCESELRIVLPLGAMQSSQTVLASVDQALVAGASRHEPWHDLGRDVQQPPTFVFGEVEAAEPPEPRETDDADRTVPTPKIAEGADASTRLPNAAIEVPLMAMARSSRRRRYLVAYVGVLALVSGGGASWYAISLSTSAREPVLNSANLLRSQGLVSEPDNPVPASPAGPIALAPVATTAAVARDAPPKVNPRSKTPPAERSRARERTRSVSRAAAEPAMPATVAPAPGAVPRAQSASIGPCTPTVAALGLCTTAQPAAKE